MYVIPSLLSPLSVLGTYYSPLVCRSLHSLGPRWADANEPRLVRWASSVYRTMMIDPQNVNTQHPGIQPNGEIWPRPLRVGGNLIIEASSGGELDLNNDLILEFPVGEVCPVQER